ncbi:MAG TPA: hypothetical protein DDX51_02120 [Clostridiales bacterium]|nr:hypothetical protein [Clostridiales bacterium]
MCNKTEKGKTHDIQAALLHSHRHVFSARKRKESFVPRTDAARFADALPMKAFSYVVKNYSTAKKG